jgi:hypothetical protein
MADSFIVYKNCQVVLKDEVIIITITTWTTVLPSNTPSSGSSAELSSKPSEDPWAIPSDEPSSIPSANPSSKPSCTKSAKRQLQIFKRGEEVEFVPP